jgi:hypothetical protein
VRIFETIEIDASMNRVWEVISDIDNEPEYWWGTREVKNLSRNGNVVDREIVQNFRNHRISQRVILKPQSEIEFRYLEGLTMGTKYLRLESVTDERQKLTAEWNVHFTGVYQIASFFIARHIRRGTRDALQRIKDVAEGKLLKETVDRSGVSNVS